ncbi:hypothetical protein AX15_005630 [Amanita polypyramis BW_CC]|nr:hypothetical protein AX15_005630 [Amanita polypyramis BW_CC]
MPIPIPSSLWARPIPRLTTIATRYLVRAPSGSGSGPPGLGVRSFSFSSSVPGWRRLGGQVEGGHGSMPASRLEVPRQSLIWNSITSASRKVYSYSTTAVNVDANSNTNINADANSTTTTTSTTNSNTALSFQTLESSIHPNTLKAITRDPFNLSTMSQVQSKVLPLLPGLAMPHQHPKSNTLDTSATPPPSSSPRDLLVKAKTGTGKTLAFLVPAIEARLRAIEQHARKALKDSGLVSDKALEARAKRTFAQQCVGTLVISPTRELATQIANEALRLTTHHQGFEVKLLVGGESRRAQVRDWGRGRKDLVVATPGRLRDLLTSEGEFVDAFKHTQLLVLDEADSLLDMGFRDDIDAIASYLPSTAERQTFLFSATVSSAIQQIAKETLDSNHLFINCVTEDDAPVHTHIKQYHTVLPSAAHQVPHVLRLLAHEQLINPGSSKTIVFLPTTKMTQLFATLLKELKKSSLPAGDHTRIYEMHSKRTMESRTRTSADFRADNSGAAVLVSSDVSARGVDYPGVTRIIQVGIPGSAQQYVHRIGRTGRGGEGGRKGRGDLVLLPWEMGFVTWGLGEVPLKPVTVGEIERQVKELAEKIDENPREYFRDHGVKDRIEKGKTQPGLKKGGFGVVGKTRAAPTGPDLFKNVPYMPVMETIETRVEELRSEMDEEAVEETFMAMLGYYTARSGEMRIDKRAVLEGCKQWAVDAGGLSRAPTVSMMMMQKLGITEDRRGRGRRPDGDRRGTFEARRGDRMREERAGHVRNWEWREGRDSPYGKAGGRGVDRGEAQARWRDRERTVGREEREARAGRSWMSRR